MVESKYDFIIHFTPTIYWARSYDYETENISISWLGFTMDIELNIK